MSKFHIFTTALVLLLFLASCGGGKSDPDPESSTDCVLGTSTIGDCKI